MVKLQGKADKTGEFSLVIQLREREYDYDILLVRVLGSYEILLVTLLQGFNLSLVTRFFFFFLTS